MVTPTSYDVTITINDVDVTQYVPYESMQQDDHRRQVGTFKFIVENPSGVTPTRGHSVVVTANSVSGTPIIFLGNITELKTSKRDNGITIEYQIDASDYKYRLQKSVIDIAELSGTDSSIISALLTNAYPDLSSIFDFSTDVTSFASGLNLAVGNKSILEALEDLSDLVGGADWSLSNVAGDDNELVTFDSGVDEPNVVVGSGSPSIPYLHFTLTAGSSLTQPALDASAGNPSYCGRWQQSTGTWYPPGGLSVGDPACFIKYISSGSNSLSDVTFDYYVNSGISAHDIEISILINTTSGNEAETITGLTYDAWTSISLATATSIPFPLTLDSTDTIRIQFQCDTAVTLSSTPSDIRIDNVETSFATAIFSGGTDQSRLQWDDAPPAADFDFDIDTSDEFGFDFDLSVGDYDDFNSVTIIGGNEEQGIDWTYPNQDDQTHINLETAIQDLAVYENTGSEGSPTWTALTVANAGEGELGVAGVDVLYDPVTHWLEFNTDPPNFYDAVRVTGNILRPIRVRVENIGAGEATYATTHSDENITSQEQAVNVGLAKLDQRNAARHLTFTTHNPGLKVGQALTVTDSTRGLNEALVIQRISTRWMNNIGVFTVECGTDDIGSIDEIIANNDRRSRDNQLTAGVTTVSVDFYTDDSDTLMTDDSDQQLYGTS